MGGALRSIGSVIDLLVFNIALPAVGYVLRGSAGAFVGALAGFVVGPGVILTGIPLAYDQKRAAEAAVAAKAAEEAAKEEAKAAEAKAQEEAKAAEAKAKEQANALEAKAAEAAAEAEAKAAADEAAA